MCRALASNGTSCLQAGLQADYTTRRMFLVAAEGLKPSDLLVMSQRVSRAPRRRPRNWRRGRDRTSDLILMRTRAPMIYLRVLSGRRGSKPASYHGKVRTLKVAVDTTAREFGGRHADANRVFLVAGQSPPFDRFPPNHKHKTNVGAAPL